VVFVLDDLRFAIEAAAVQEVVRAVEVMPFPGAPAIVLGVIDVRGAIVPVLDLKRRFGLPARELGVDDHLVLARAPPRIVALWVDHVVGLTTIAPGDLLPVEDAVASRGYIAGAVRHPDGLILIHDISTFLSAAESMQLEQALA
jgi:purine-binding chemotaxis protein CheW